MPDLMLDQRAGLPDALRVLAETYPRDTWQGHGNFGQMVQFWMERHMMFRQLIDLLVQDARSALDGQLSADRHAPRLARFGGTFLNELHAHHSIEDHHYFPRLMQLDPRIARGFDLLEADHHAIDPMLHDLAGAANAVLQGGPPDGLHHALERFSGLLDRHLTDEEDLVVPVILHSGFDG
ncbi:MAG: hemerythrin domain-containing protein [Rhodobacteraceae bacterium]|nr:hemerythrin domain-containing protein [Paracoccaceae bacterium]